MATDCINCTNLLDDFCQVYTPCCAFTERQALNWLVKFKFCELMAAGSPPPVTRLDVEYICNETTGFWDRKEVTSLDGIFVSETTTATTIPCTQPAPVVHRKDFEYVCNETSGFYDKVEREYNQDGTLLGETTTPSTYPCTKQEEVDLVYTDAVSICVDNAGVKTNALTREKIVFNNITQVEVRVIEYSLTGDVWSPVTPTGIISLGECKFECFTPTNICKCYKQGVVTTYTNADAFQDIGFSSNTTTLKWKSSGADGSDVVTNAIRNCILAGNVAEISITASSGVVVTFSATSILNDSGGPGGIGGYAFSGTSAGGSSGDALSVTVTCGSKEGTACLFVNCDGNQEWRDVVTPDVGAGTDYTIVDVTDFVECPEECKETEVLELIQCATEATAEVAIGDYILSLITVCSETREVLGSVQYNISNGNIELTTPVEVESCDPTPEIQEIQTCLIDTNGVRWTQIAIIIAGTPPTVVSTVYYNQSTLQLGTPAGSPSLWTSCERPTVLNDRGCVVKTNGTSIPVQIIKVVDDKGTILSESFYNFGQTTQVVVDTEAGDIVLPECPKEDCLAPSLREVWHYEVLQGQVAKVDISLQSGYDLPEAIANNINGTTLANYAGPVLARYFPKSIYAANLASGGSWVEPGPTGSIYTNPSGYYNYTGTVSAVVPHLWPYAGVKINADFDTTCAPPANVDFNVSFEWRYDGPHPLPIATAPGDAAIIAWLINTTTNTVLAQNILSEMTITSIGQTGVISFSVPGIASTSVSDLAVIIAVNTAERITDPADTVVVGAGLATKRNGYTVRNLLISATGVAQCPRCVKVFKEYWCDGIRYKDENDAPVDVTGLNLSFGGCPEAVYYPYSYESCADIGGTETPVRVFELRDATGAVFNRRIEDNAGNDVTATATLVECGTCCGPTLLPVNQRCDSYIRTNNVANNAPNSSGWLSGYAGGTYADKWSNVATYDLLLNDTNPPLAGAPRQLQYQVSGDVNGTAFSGTVTVPVPTASYTGADLAAAINAIIGANVLGFDSYGWYFQYNTAWASLNVVIREFADNHAGGFQDISFGRAWVVRLNAGVLEDGIGVDPNDLNNGTYFVTSNCQAI